MWDKKNEDELNYILKDFDDIPYLALESSSMVTPEHRFYKLHDDNDQVYGILTGEFMGDLLRIAQDIEYNTDFAVEKWFYSRVGQSETQFFEGNEYAVCLLVQR
ncbi:MAG: hypothetical protein Q4E47_00855 [Candidatus Saccharibacteria bacterium]|nr:hypothetical protein [Candidatus Saccharibacteria bacterium]